MASQVTIKSSGTGAYTPLILLGLVGAGVWLYKKKVQPVKQLINYASRLRVYLPTLRFKGDNFVFDAYIQNVNSVPVTIDAIVGEVYIRTPQRMYKLANIANYGHTVVRATSETKFTFELRQRFLGWFQYLSDLAQGKIKKGQMGEFHGNINVNGQVHPLNFSVKLS